MSKTEQESLQELVGHVKTAEEQNILLEGLEKFERSLYRSGFAARERALREELPESVAHHFEALMAKPPYAEDLGVLREFVVRLKRSVAAIVPVRLEVAFELSEETVIHIQEWVKKNLDVPVVLDIRVDPSLIGGARIMCRGHYFDGTLGEILNRVFSRKRKEILTHLLH